MHMSLGELQELVLDREEIGRASCRERVSDFVSWGSKITADGDCSHETKRRLLLGSKVITNLDSIFNPNPNLEGGRRRGCQDEMVGWHHQLNGHESG